MVQYMNMPKLGLSSESSLIGQWLKKKGDYVKQGETLLTVETDKSIFEVESEIEGYVLELLYSEGDEVQVLEPIVAIGEQGEVYEKQHVQSPTPPTSKILPESNQEAAIYVEEQKDEQRIKISPRARLAAQKRNLPIASIQGTGPNERILEVDILTYSKFSEEEMDTKSNKDVTSEYKEMSNMRKIIAKNMMNSLHNSAQLTLNTSFNARQILKLRQRFKNLNNADFQAISINEMILFAVSRVLKDHPQLNAHIDGMKIKEFEQVHLGVALDLPRGLIVPTLFGADQLSLTGISKRMKSIYEKCNENAILPEDLQGATFTVTNLGALGIESFTPILNPPQVAILGVCTTIYKVKLVGEEQVVYPSIPLSLTFDHRAVDGATVARFLKDLVDGLENMDLLMAR